MLSCLSKAVALGALALVCSRAERIKVPMKGEGRGALSQIERGGLWGFADASGRVVIERQFDDERMFFHGLAGALPQAGKWGFIDRKGKFVIPAQFEEVRDFTDDLAPVRVGRKWGYINTSGQLVIEPRFQTAGNFHEGLARVHVWSKVDCVGRGGNLTSFTSEDAPLYAFQWFEDSGFDMQACFPKGGKFGFIDKTGNYVIEPQYFIAQDFSEGLAAVRIEESPDSKYGYVDRSGQMVIPPRYFQAEPFSEGLAAVETSARIVGISVVDIAYGFIDKTGMLRIPDVYSYARSFYKGRAEVTIGTGEQRREVIIDKTGRVVGRGHR